MTDWNADGWRITRRAFCASPLLMAAAAAVPETDLANDIATYVGFGTHRVGSTGERKTAQWLRKRLARLGYAARLDRFPVTTVIKPAGRINVGSAEIEAFPQWLPPAGGLGAAITAPLISFEQDDTTPAIRLVEKAIPFTPNWTPQLDAMVSAAAAKGARALIIAVDIPSGDLFACNQHSRTALPIPVALVARIDLVRLSALIGQPATLRLSGKIGEVQSINVIGEKPGRGRRLVISTPLTGWFTCGGERGPGIALWLRMAAMLAASDRPVTLLGTGSHEVGHFGMEHALAHGAPTPDQVAFWLHFGASLAATKLDAQYRFRSPQYLVGLSETETLAKDALLAAAPIYVPGTSATQGEAGQIIGAGHRRFVGLSGMFPAFHTPLDLGQAVDFDRLERIAAGAAALLKRVAGGA